MAILDFRDMVFVFTLLCLYHASINFALIVYAEMMETLGATHKRHPQLGGRGVEGMQKVCGQRSQFFRVL